MPINSGITIIRNNDTDPVFTWSVGSDNVFANTGSYKYMATVRANPNSSRIPTHDIVYRESGITDTRWEFSLTKNIASSGGPYRDYQVVIEAYNAQGKTSAGNQVGAEEARNWNRYSNGYDLIEISNLRQGGIDTSLSIPTETILGSGYYRNTGDYTGNYYTFQYMTSKGDISIEFLSGSFDSDLVGGFLYVSSGRFPKNETSSRSGEWRDAVTKTQFDFNLENPKIFAQNAAYNIKHLPYGYMSLSFYDVIDSILLKSGVDISSGLYLSDNAVIEREIIDNGDSSLVIGRVTGVATSIDDPIITQNIALGTHVLGFTTGESYTNIVYVNGGYTSNIISGRFPVEPYLPRVTGAMVYLSNVVDDTLFVAVNNYPIRNIPNPDFDPSDFVQYNIYTGATGVGIFLKRGDIIRFQARGNYNAPATWRTASWTGTVGYSDGSSERFFGGKYEVGNIGAQPVFVDMGYFVVGQRGYPTN
jgi:hypothetical protein